VVAHCPNTGSLQGCLVEGATAYLAPATDPARKLQWTWKLAQVGPAWIGVDTSIAPTLVHESISSGVLTELGGYARVVSEVRYGAEQGSRIDLLLARGGREPAGLKPAALARAQWDDEERVYVEVKNTTLRLDRDGVAQAAFPDAVTERGRKHLHELMHVIDQGHRAAMVFSVQRNDCTAFVPADAIDPAYGQALRQAVKHGVEIYALAATLDPAGVSLTTRLPVEL